MKRYSLIKIIFFVLITIGISCEKNESMIVSQFELYLGNRYADNSSIERKNFVMATSPVDGELLYWGIDLKSDDIIQFDAKDLETVDLTVGTDHGYNNNSIGFYINTYRDIKSGFDLSDINYACYKDEFTVNTISSVELIIDGTKEISEIVNPLSKSSRIEDGRIMYDYVNDKTVIQGSLFYSEDLQFTFLFSGETTYKSIIIPSEDWIKVDGNRGKKEVKIIDLTDTKVHEIDIGIDSDWAVNAEIITTKGNRIILSRYDQNIDLQTGAKIKLFINKDIDLEKLILDVSNYRINESIDVRDEGYHYQNEFNNIPSSIILRNQFKEPLEVTPTSFNIPASENNDLVKMNYIYYYDFSPNVRKVNWWTIYQTSNSSLSYNLPKIIPAYLDNSTKMKNILSNPNFLHMQSYSIDEVDLDKRYYTTGIQRQLKCLQFNSKYKRIDF